MLRSLWIKFLLLLLSVSVIALSATLFLRELMVKDFKEYLEGELEDRVYWVMADLEGIFEKYAGWKEDVIAEDTVWALMLGLEIKIYDLNGQVIMDKERALNRLSPSRKMKVMSMIHDRKAGRAEEFQPYPLFLGGREIGHLEVRFLRSGKEAVFIAMSNKLLLISLFVLGGLSIFLSVFFSRRLTRPINHLTATAKDIVEGNLEHRVTVSGRDEISRLSATFNKMLDALKLQESLRKKLISDVAHELRTPLSAMRGELEGMLDELIPTNKEQIQSLYDEAGRLKNLLEGMEELVQAQASSLTLKKQSLKLKPFLENIVERFGKYFLNKNVSLELKGHDKLVIYADPDRLGQIVINLLSNAIKATDQHGHVLIKTEKREDEVLIEIADNGCGISQENLPFIFERFYKVSAGGLGLGLAIVKELVEAHEGRIEAKSEPGKGSVFTVFLPVKDLYNS